MQQRLVFLVLALSSCAAVQDVAPSDPQAHAPSVSPAGSPQAVDWFHAGPYLGISGGQSISNASASDLDSDLADRGWTTSSKLDDTDFGWKVFGGWRFEEPWALELAFVELGTVESEIAVSTPMIDDFLNDVKDVHPYSGAGVTLTGTYFPLVRDRYELGVKGGLWYFESNVDAGAATGEKADIDESSFRPLIGALLTADAYGNFSLRAEWEHYFLDSGNEVDLVTLGLQYAIR